MNAFKPNDVTNTMPNSSKVLLTPIVCSLVSRVLDHQYHGTRMSLLRFFETVIGHLTGHFPANYIQLQVTVYRQLHRTANSSHLVAT